MLVGEMLQFILLAVKPWNTHALLLGCMAAAIELLEQICIRASALPYEGMFHIYFKGSMPATPHMRPLCP